MRQVQRALLRCCENRHYSWGREPAYSEQSLQVQRAHIGGAVSPSTEQKEQRAHSGVSREHKQCALCAVRAESSNQRVPKRFKGVMKGVRGGCGPVFHLVGNWGEKAY